MVKLLSWVVLSSYFLSGCVTRDELRRQQELDQLKLEVQETKGNRADTDVIAEQFKAEISRLEASWEGHLQRLSSENTTLREEIANLNQKVASLEQAQSPSVSKTEKEPESAPVKISFAQAKKLYDLEQFDEAIEMLNALSSEALSRDDKKKTLFLLGESYFAKKDYASAALSFSEYRQNYPKDAQVPLSIYRQAQAFRLRGQGKESKLFYAELIEKYPRHSLAAKSKSEMAKIK